MTLVNIASSMNIVINKRIKLQKERTKMKTFILASKNQHKAEEIKNILGENYEVITQTEAGVGDIEVIEDGTTFEENAVKKAETILKAVGKPVIADDSGLCVDLLNGSPGVYTARFAGENATDAENISKLLSELDGQPMDKRTAKFVCVIAFARPNEKTMTFRGECSGRIALSPSGESGFGYDPVFYLDDFQCTLAEVPAEVKNSISHRFKALKKFADSLN